MFEKMKLNKKIKEIMDNIEAIEQKRTRSQAALIQSILVNDTPSDSDVDFFNRYTQEIEDLRLELQELKMQLEKK